MTIYALFADTYMTNCSDNIGKQATIQSGSSVFLYANPAIMYFAVTLTAHSSKSKPVNSADWVKKLHKLKSNVQHIDTELDFGGGKYAFLRLSRADKGFLEVVHLHSCIFNNRFSSMLATKTVTCSFKTYFILFLLFMN